MADAEFFDSKIAGWWAWGLSSWIGSGFCSGGPWGAVDDESGVPAFGKLPHLGGGRGVNRQLPHLGGGQGVDERRLEWLKGWFLEIADLLREARVSCGSWERIMSAGTMTRFGACGVVLDPPYCNSDDVYAHDSNTVAHDVVEWCLANGDNPKLRIALCGYAGDYALPDSWECVAWHAAGGYQGAEDRERIWFSPHCKKPLAAPEQLTIF